MFGILDCQFRLLKSLQLLPSFLDSELHTSCIIAPYFFPFPHFLKSTPPPSIQQLNNKEICTTLDLGWIASFRTGSFGGGEPHALVVTRIREVLYFQELLWRFPHHALRPALPGAAGPVAIVTAATRVALPLQFFAGFFTWQ